MPTRPVLVEGNRADIFRAIEAERLRQIDLGYTAAQDDRNAHATWVMILARHLGLAAYDGQTTADLGHIARQMKRIAAVAVAALETLARAGVSPAEEVDPTEEPPTGGADPLEFPDCPVPVLAPESRSRIG